MKCISSVSAFQIHLRRLHVTCDDDDDDDVDGGGGLVRLMLMSTQQMLAMVTSKMVLVTNMTMMMLIGMAVAKASSPSAPSPWSMSSWS